jgi:hypothetical protein
MSNNHVSENSLFNYLIERLPFLNNLELIKELKNYSSLLKTYLSSRVTTRSYSPVKAQLRESLKKIYNLTSSTTNLLESNTIRGFEQVENKVNSNGMKMLKHVYYTTNRIIKKNKHSKRDNLPYLLNEAIINIVLEYVCLQAGRNDVPEFRRFTKVAETNRNEITTSNINWNYEMEKIQGITLHEYITSSRFDINILIDILHQVLDILQFLQTTCGFFHGDLNSSNVMLIPLEGDRYKVKLIDFGFSLIDTNYLNNQQKYVLTNTRNLNTDSLFINFTANGNINRESKTNLKFVDFYHLLFFVYKDLKKSKKIKIANKLKNTFQFTEGINLNRVEEDQIHELTRKYELIPYNFTSSNRNLDELLEVFRQSLIPNNFINNANENRNENENSNGNENENENNGNNFFQRMGGPRGLSYGNNGSGNNGSGNGFLMSRGSVQSFQPTNRGQSARRQLNLTTASYSPSAIRRPLNINNSNNEEGTPKKRGKVVKGLFNS